MRTKRKTQRVRIVLKELGTPGAKPLKTVVYQVPALDLARTIGAAIEAEARENGEVDPHVEWE